MKHRQVKLRAISLSGQSGSEQSSLTLHMWIYDLIHFSAKFKGKTLSCIQVNTVLKLLSTHLYTCTTRTAE